MRPPSVLSFPMKSLPLRNVPAVKITARASNSAPIDTLTPEIDDSRKVISVTESCQISKLQVFSRIWRQFIEKRALSHCARGLHIAGPFERLSILNCIVDASVTTPLNPPSASISLTIWPFAIPPIAGLHDIWAVFPISIVMRSTLDPSLAAATAASHPACPAPMTIMSYLPFIP